MNSIVMARSLLAARNRHPTQTLSGGGCPSTPGRLGSKHAHFGADFVQMVAVGAAMLGSSSVPPPMKVSVGRSSASLKICVPHFVQKRLCIVAPLSARHT